MVRTLQIIKFLNSTKYSYVLSNPYTEICYYQNPLYYIDISNKIYIYQELSMKCDLGYPAFWSVCILYKKN